MTTATTVKQAIENRRRDHLVAEDLAPARQTRLWLDVIRIEPRSYRLRCGWSTSRRRGRCSSGERQTSPSIFRGVRTGSPDLALALVGRFLADNNRRRGHSLSKGLYDQRGRGADVDG